MTIELTQKTPSDSFKSEDSEKDAQEQPAKKSSIKRSKPDYTFIS